MSFDADEFEKLQKVAKNRAKRGLKTPSFSNRPVLRSDLIPVWNAFQELSGRRQVGFGPCPITITDIMAWLDLNEVRLTDRRRWYYGLIASMDNRYLVLNAERKDKK